MNFKVNVLCLVESSTVEPIQSIVLYDIASPIPM